jgi:hypothetical protein
MRWKVMPLEHVFWSYIQPEPSEMQQEGTAWLSIKQTFSFPPVWCLNRVRKSRHRSSERRSFPKHHHTPSQFLFRQPFPCDNNKSNDLRIRPTWLCATFFLPSFSRLSSKVIRIRFPMAIVIELPRLSCLGGFLALLQLFTPVRLQLTIPIERLSVQVTTARRLWGLSRPLRSP